MIPKWRLLRWLLTLQGVTYLLAGAAFLSTGNPGGISLGLLFFGAATLLYLVAQLLKEVRKLRRGLADTSPLTTAGPAPAPQDRPP